MNTQPAAPRKERTVLSIYAGAVCFIMVMCFTVALSITVYDVVSYNFPQLTVDEREQLYILAPGFEMSKGTGEKPTRAEMIASEKRGALRDIVKYSIVMAVNIIVFVLHWLLLRRRRN